VLTTTSNLLLKLLEVNKKNITEQNEVIDGHSKQLIEQSDKINKLEDYVDC
jgi:uncharacterized coiled-coil protein SlyX